MLFEIGEPKMLEEIDTMPKEIQVECIAPEGLGYGHGSISVQDRLQNLEDLDQPTLATVQEIIESDRSMVPVEANDDGCPDGRSTASIIMGKDRQTIPGHKHRPKVFGGGATMATAALIGSGAIDARKETLHDAFEYGIFRLEDAGLNFGGHSAVKTSEGKSGCGAIDEAPNIVASIGKYKEEITGTIKALLDPTQDQAELNGMLETAFEHFDSLRDAERDQQATIEQYPVQYKGATVLSKFLARDKKIAELDGVHKEVAVVMNIDVEGMTFDQDAVRKSTNDTAQIFAIDVPRMREIAEGIFEYEPDQKRALVSMFIYSLSTAATLTKGDLPVFVQHQANDRYITL